MDPRPADQVIAAAQLLGLTISDEDLGWLAGALAGQRAVDAVLDGLALDEVDPLLTFDPRWHD